jgi:hypothetical protein
MTIKLDTTLGMKNFGRGKGHINGDIVIMKRNIKCGRWARKRIVSVCCTVGPVHHGGTFSEPSVHDVMMVKKLSDFRSFQISEFWIRNTKLQYKISIDAHNFVQFVYLASS